MRYAVLLLVLAACAGNPTPSATAPAPSYAPVETVTVRASAGETTRRLVGIYAADGITVASHSGGTITTAPVQSIGLTAGSGANQATGVFQY